MGVTDTERRNIDRAQAHADYVAQCQLPELPSSLSEWFSFMRATEHQDLYLAEDFLSAPRATDANVLLQMQEGYRFILDRAASTPSRLIWNDLVRSGGWAPGWVVLTYAYVQDPLVADVTAPSISIVQLSPHKRTWQAEPRFASVSELIHAINVHDRPQPSTEPVPWYEVVLTDLGPIPKRTLLALKSLPEFSALDPVGLLALTPPLTLIDATVSEEAANRVANRLRAVGALVEVRVTARPSTTAI